MKLALASAAMNNDGIVVVANVYAYDVSSEEEETNWKAKAIDKVLRFRTINHDEFTHISHGNAHYDPKTNSIKIPLNVPENMIYIIGNVITKWVNVYEFNAVENGIITISINKINSKTIYIDVYGVFEHDFHTNFE